MTDRRYIVNIKCVIVIYNMQCEDSRCLVSILKLKTQKLNLIVCDNSNVSLFKKNNREFCEENHIEYIDMQGNHGLSRAYNKALTKVEKNEWVVLFDQDTRISNNYFVELEKSVNTYPHIYIHVPIVKSEKLLMSPSLASKYKVSKTTITKPGLYTDITAINSGMAINRKVFTRVGKYNEEIFLDYLDHYFIRQYKKEYDQIALFNCVLNQEFSNNDHSNITRDLTRFKIYKDDFYQFCKDSARGKLFYLTKILYRAFKLSYLHHNAVFIKSLVERAKK